MSLYCIMGEGVVVGVGVIVGVGVEGTLTFTHIHILTPRATL